MSANVTALQQNVALLNENMQHGLNQAYEGTAVAIAMSGSALPDNKRFAVTSNWGKFPRHQRDEFHRPSAHQRQRRGQCCICRRLPVWWGRHAGRSNLRVVAATGARRLAIAPSGPTAASIART